MSRWTYQCAAGTYCSTSLAGLLRAIFEHRWWHYRRNDGWTD